MLTRLIGFVMKRFQRVSWHVIGPALTLFWLASALFLHGLRTRQANQRQRRERVAGYGHVTCAAARSQQRWRLQQRNGDAEFLLFSFFFFLFSVYVTVLSVEKLSEETWVNTINCVSIFYILFKKPEVNPKFLLYWIFRLYCFYIQLN